MRHPFDWLPGPARGLVARSPLLWLIGCLGLPSEAASRFCDVPRHVNPGESPLRLVKTPGVDVPTSGIQRLLFLRIRYLDDRADPVEAGEAEATLAEVDAIFRRISGGRFGLTWTVSPVLSIGKSREDYLGPGGFDRLLDDARAAGIAAGFDYRDHDFEVVRHSGVSDFAGGNARLGQRGAQVQVGGPLILVHELGHNLGLSHANAWATSGPGISLGSPPLPSNYGSLPEPRTIPIHPDSVIGHDDPLGPGQPVEYGDSWDIMGSGDFSFGAGYLEFLGWLPPGVIVEPPQGWTRMRIWDGDENSPSILASLGPKPRAIRLAGPRGHAAGDRDYLVELPVSRWGAAPLPGVVIRWVDPMVAAGPNLLIDPTPGSPGSSADAILAPGRTFSDPLNQVHVTVAGWGGDGKRVWADLVVFRGAEGTNRAPEISMDGTPLTLGVGEAVSLTASAIDPDGDELVWFWDFGDGRTSTGSLGPTRSWEETGDYVVRVEVSDQRGGSASRIRPVRVGSPKSLTIGGTVRDGEGRPVAGARVHSGIGGGGRVGPDVASGWTDSTGAYRLTGLSAGTYPVSVFHPAYRARRRSAVPLEDAGVEGIDLVIDRLPEVRVSGVGSVTESGALMELFTFTRTGSLDQALTVLFRLGGSAGAGTDYAGPMVDRLVIPAGSATVTLGLALIDDREGEGDEVIRVTVANPVQSTRFDARGEAYQVYYPGWELEPWEGVAHWTRTRPAYVGGGNWAEVRLIDDDEWKDQTVSVAGSETVALEYPWVESQFTVTRDGSLEGSLTVALAVGGDALPGSDYEPLPEVVVFGPGETQRFLPVRPVSDEVDEEDETVELRIVPADPYGVGRGRAQVSIRDRLVYSQTVTLHRRLDGVWEVGMSAAPGSRLILEASPDLVTWEPIRTNLLFNTDRATLVLPDLPGARFLRTVRR